MSRKQASKVLISPEKITQLSQQGLRYLNANFAPHAGQQKILRALFVDGKKKIFAQCGRKFGKTHQVVYACIRWALSKPFQAIYIICPDATQGREIYWHSGVMKQMAPAFAVEFSSKQEGRMTFYNGSFIKIAGTNDPDSLRGPNPHFACFDEFKDCNAEFWHCFKPNLMPNQAPFLAVGTPPDNDVDPSQKLYLSLAEECRSSPVGFWMEAPSAMNPHLDKDWLNEEISLLVARGDADVAEREYMGRYVKGGAKLIFPMFCRDPLVHVVEHAELIRSKILGHERELEYGVTVDPGTTSRFAALFSAHHRKSKEVYHLAELYEGNQGQNSTMQMATQIEAICKRIMPVFDRWLFTVDEAAAWFLTELIANNFGHLSFVTTQKAEQKKRPGELMPGMTTLKDQMLAEKVKFSDQCPHAISEFRGYALTKAGTLSSRLPDHLIDCARYFNYRIAYSLVGEKWEDSNYMDKLREEKMDADWGMYNLKQYTPDENFDVERNLHLLMGDDFVYDPFG